MENFILIVNFFCLDSFTAEDLEQYMISNLSSESTSAQGNIIPLTSNQTSTGLKPTLKIEYMVLTIRGSQYYYDLIKMLTLYFNNDN